MNYRINTYLSSVGVADVFLYFRNVCRLFSRRVRRINCHSGASVARGQVDVMDVNVSV